jgi:hypothetical protein
MCEVPKPGKSGEPRKGAGGGEDSRRNFESFLNQNKKKKRMFTKYLA